MSFKALIVSTFFALLSGQAMAGFIVGNQQMSHDQAAQFCKDQGSNLADVTQANVDQLKQSLNGQPGWIRSWDSNFYTGSCTYSINGHIGPSDCSNMLLPVCNAVNLLKSTAADAEPKPKQCAPRRSRNSRCSRPQSSSSSGYCGSSSSSDCDAAFQYVYLTNTVTSSFTSTASSTSTVTSTNLVYFATVAAYTVTGEIIP